MHKSFGINPAMGQPAYDTNAGFEVPHQQRTVPAEPAPSKSRAECIADAEVWQVEQALKEEAEKVKRTTKKRMRNAKRPQPNEPKPPRNPKRPGIEPGYRQAKYKQLCRCSGDCTCIGRQDGNGSTAG